MHNLKANIDKFFLLAKSVFQIQADSFGNLRHYPNGPKVSDIQVIAIALAAEATQIPSENMLYTILRSQLPHEFLWLPHRTSYNRRLKSLRPYIDELASLLSDDLIGAEKRYIIDSIPIPVCRLARFFRLKIMQNEHGFGPRKAEKKQRHEREWLSDLLLFPN